MEDIVHANEKQSGEMDRSDLDRLLDEALEETFPASDPISLMCPLSVH